ncbi:ATPase, T2SS/T4P/T4SS family [uncultured Zhongshania sp.]|uniref:ATPase, T2SS/T4P/T4SS family n=1 Tax=uncultured Zhongshania sp. TaxID=1642288 RepID=UPI0030D6EFBB|tara:strand:+ start:1273 stop:2982 length:1710 start_codon:yes stop_codon:yes gene_type:complete
MKVLVQTKKGTMVGKLFCEADSFLIGKGSACLVDLSGWKVSKCHAEVNKLSGGVFVREADQKYPIYVNATRIMGEYGPLRQGDKIGIGDYIITLEDFAIKAEPEKLLGGVVPVEPVLATSAVPVEKEKINIETSSLMPNDDAERRELIRAWKLKIHASLLKTMDLRRTNISTLNDVELRALSAEIISEAIAKSADFPRALSRSDIARQVLDEAVGLGPLEELLARNDISEVMVNSCDEVYYEEGGRLIKSNICFSDDKAVLSAIERIVTPLGRRIDESSPMVDARLKDGSRVNAIIPPLALKGPTITIRKFMQEKLTIGHLIGFSSLNKEMADFLDIAVNQRLNIIISGGTGSGKTTLLNALSNFIPDNERIVTVEDAAELKLNKPHVVSLEARPPNQEGSGAVTIRDLVKNCLRMRPDRIVVGECRSGEALDMLQAMNTGHDGSLTTVHSNSPRDCISRLEVLVLMSGMDLPVAAIREQIASAVDIIVQQTRFACGSRKITSISEVTGVEGNIVQLSEIFRFTQSGYNEDGRVIGQFEAMGQVPEFYEQLSARGIAVDLDIFTRQQAG